MQNTVGPYSVLGFLDLALVSSIVWVWSWRPFDFSLSSHPVITVIIGAPLQTVLVRSCEVGGRSSTLLVIFSGESADGCCPRLDIYSNIDYFLFQAILPNKFCIVIKYQVWVVFFLICCCLDLCVCTLQWHSALLQKVLECQYFAKWPGGSHQQTFYRIHPLRREGC